MTSRPLVLVFLLLILIITSQFEWKQQLVNELDADPGLSPKQLRTMKREEEVKEKIILRQEKEIQYLHGLVQNLQHELLQCRSGKANATDTFTSHRSNISSDIAEKQDQND